MAAMLADARSRGEAFAGLLASESVIYGRFGFGHATTAMEVTIDSRRSAFLVPGPGLDLRLVDRDEAAKVLPELFDRFRRYEGRRAEPERGACGRTTWTTGRPAATAASGHVRGGVRRTGYVTYRAYDADIMRAEYPTVVIEELRGLTPDGRGGPVAVRLRPGPGRRGHGQAPAGRRAAALAARRPPPAQGQRGSTTGCTCASSTSPPPSRAGATGGPIGSSSTSGRPPTPPTAGPTRPRADGCSRPARTAPPAAPARPGEAADLRLGLTELGALYLGGVASFDAGRRRAGGGAARREPRPGRRPAGHLAGAAHRDRFLTGRFSLP